MASIKSRLEANSSGSEDESSSIAPYATFNSLTAEDSVEQIRKKNNNNIDINGDPPHYRSTDSVADQKLARLSYCRYIDITVVVVIVALVWLMMLLPTVFYIYHTVTVTYLKQQNTSNHTTSNSNNATCTWYDETSDTCKKHLQWYTKCLKGADSAENKLINVSVSSPYQQDKADDFIKKLSLVARTPLASPQCVSSLEPLICLHYIHLCDDETNADIGQSEKQCRYISKVCEEELKKIMLLPYFNSQVEEFLSQVEEFLSSCARNSPFDEKNCIVPNTSIQDNCGTDKTCINTNSRIQNCSAGFFIDETGKCVPECSVWTPFPQNIVLITDILTIIPAAVSVISGCATLLFSWTRCQKMYRYPSVFVIYQTIPAIVLPVLVLVGVSARKNLFCRSRNLIESVKDPTPFCLITGIVFYYVVIQLLLWWLWHTIAVFWAVISPVHANTFNRSERKRLLHKILVLAGIVLPAVPILIVIFGSNPRGGFTITRAPPILCAGYNIHVNFWAFIFPMSLLLAVGVTLLVFILRSVIKVVNSFMSLYAVHVDYSAINFTDLQHHCLSKIHKIKVNLNWAVETKVLIVLCYYIVLGAAVLTVFTKALLNIDTHALIEYFACESSGLSPNSNATICEKETESVQKSFDPITIAAAIVILGFLPVVNLVYVVKLSELKNKIKTYSQTRYVQHIQKEPDRSSSTRYIPYNEHRNTILHCDSMTMRDNTVYREVTSQLNKDLRK